jgi:hypothetical protein
MRKVVESVWEYVGVCGYVGMWVWVAWNATNLVASFLMWYRRLACA